MIQLLKGAKITPHFQLLPMSKVEESLLRIHEVPLLQLPKSHIIPTQGKERNRTAARLKTSNVVAMFK